MLDTDRAPSTSRKRDNAAGMVTVIRCFADEVFLRKVDTCKEAQARKVRLRNQPAAFSPAGLGGEVEVAELRVSSKSHIFRCGAAVDGFGGKVSLALASSRER